MACTITRLKAEELNQAIRPHLGIVDDLLAELISPTNRPCRSTSLKNQATQLATYSKSIWTGSDGVRWDTNGSSDPSQLLTTILYRLDTASERLS